MTDRKGKGFSATNTEAPHDTNTTAADLTKCLKSKQVPPLPPGVVELTGSAWEDARMRIHRFMVFGAKDGAHCVADFEDAPDGCVAIRAEDGPKVEQFFVSGWRPTPRISAGELFAQVQKIFAGDESCERAIQILNDLRKTRRLVQDAQHRGELREDLADEFSARAETCVGLLDFVCDDLRNLRGVIPHSAAIFIPSPIGGGAA